MTTQDHSHPRVENLISGFTEWLRHRRELNEMRQLDRNEFDRIANDLRVSPDELDELVRHGPHAADELPKLLKVLGIEEADLAAAQPLLLRDMERVCALCIQKRQCDHDLADGTIAGHYRDYCLNAPSIDQIGSEAKASEKAG